jgi:2-C-methyl-D-erythritol 2,4-cyclodiphosphate synthase
MTPQRIGSGYDVHRLVPGRPLVLGGVTIPYHKGLLGHSDADVLVHAACDALLGAAGLGDIGSHFPDHCAAFKDIYSITLLSRCGDLLSDNGYRLVNLDATLFAQSPKIMPYAGDMVRTMSQALKVEANQINIKATTTEGLGFIGRGDGIAASCVVLIEQSAK